MQRTFVISSMTGGGAARTTANLANHHAACGEKVQILTLHQPHAADGYPLHPSVVRRDLGDAKPSAGAISSAIAQLARFQVPVSLVAHAPTIARLRDFVEQTLLSARSRQECLLYIGVGDVTNIRLLLAAHGLPLRVIVTEVADPWGYSIGVWERLRVATYRQAHAVVCLAEEFAEFFRDQGIERAYAIAVPVEPAPPRDGHARERLIVSHGRLSWEKDLALLIRAFADVAPAHPEWRLEIWGNGPLRRELEQLVSALGLEDRVRMPGLTQDVYEPLARAELFALTSRTEGVPNALCEAMAAGVAPVAVDCSPGVREVIRDGVDGVIVRPRTREAFASALDALMRDDARRARLAVRAAEVVTRFATERIAAEWDELIEPGKVRYAC